jgi:hypothetical protein
MFKKLSSHFVSEAERVTYADPDVVLYRVELGIAVNGRTYVEGLENRVLRKIFRQKTEDVT